MKTKNLTLMLLFLIGIIRVAWSQTATGTFTQEPCNDDGIFTVTTTGISLPITYTYYIDGNTIVHPNVNSGTDQLNNIGMTNSGYIYCEVSSGGFITYAQANYTPQFIFDLTSSSPVCPVLLGSISANQVSGTPGPFSFTWTNEQSLEVFTGNNPVVSVGNYSAVIIDQTTGCKLEINDSAAYISQLSSITATTSSTTANCTNGTATAVASGGIAPYSYSWSNGANGSTITGLSMGYYYVTITDAQGCNTSDYGIYVNQSPQILVNHVVSNATCLDPNGSVTAFASGGTGPYSYSWNNGQTTQTATNLLGQNSYNVVVTDVNGCVGQAYAYVSSTTPINVTYTSTPSQCISPTGSATITASGGTAPYVYQWLTIPSVNSPTITNQAAGTYSFQVTDANGCARSGQVVINPVSSINATVQSSTVYCPATTGSVFANATGSNPPFTYTWSNGSNTPTISSVPLGTYGCTITDALGCSVTKWGVLSSTSPINIGLSTTPATCIFNSDGSVNSTVTGGTAPYSYLYSNGATTPNTNNLNVSGHTLIVSDVNGCSNSKYFTISNGNTTQDCYCTISGSVYADANSNCSQEIGENGIQNIMIHCSGIGYVFTDANGNYSFQVPSGTYTVSQILNPYYPLSSCQNNSNTVNVLAASGCINEVNFSNNVIPIHDLKIVTMNATNPPIPGNPYFQKIIVKNEGTISESTIQLGYEKDEQIPFASATLPSFTQLSPLTAPDWFSVQSGFPTLTPNASQVILLEYNTPTTIPIGTNLTYIDTVTHDAPINVNWLLDNTTWNNYNFFQTTVIGSYDPNYKEVYPKGDGPNGNISTDVTEFDYTIHFQNEGTYYAQNIVVTDQLDSDFDWTTFKPGYSEYEYTATINETGLLTFTFSNINLPWKSSFGDVLSSAFVNYSIKRKSTTGIGTVFTNSADIFFDYNAPITTNTTINTINSLGVNESNSINYSENNGISLYPVPANNQLNIQIDNNKIDQKVTIQIVNLTGSIVSDETVLLSEKSYSYNKDVSNLMSGTYLIKFHFENGEFVTKKIIVQHN